MAEQNLIQRNPKKPTTNSNMTINCRLGKKIFDKMKKIVISVTDNLHTKVLKRCNHFNGFEHQYA